VAIVSRRAGRAICSLPLIVALTSPSAMNAADALPADRSQPGEAEISQTTVVAGLQRLVQENPDVLRFKANLAQSCVNLADLQFSEGRWAAASNSYQLAIRYQQMLREVFPEVVEYQSNVARSYWALATTQQNGKRFDAAIQSYEHAIEVQRAIVMNNPEVPDYPFTLSSMYVSLGRAQRDNRAYPQAEESHKLAVDLLEELANTDSEARAQLPEALAIYGDTLAVALRWQAAADAYGKAVKLNNQMRRFQTRRALLQWAAGDKAGYQATCADLMKRWGRTNNAVDALWTSEACVVGEDAVTDPTAVVALAKRALAGDPGSPMAKTVLGAAQLRAGQVDNAIQTLKSSLPRHALVSILAPNQVNSIRLNRLLGETCLARAYLQQGDNDAVAAQAKKIEDLIAILEKPATQEEAELLPWSTEVALELAKRDLAQLQQSIAAK
jgi:tetratricopeptide (TPR) repeat protein